MPQLKAQTAAGLGGDSLNKSVSPSGMASGRTPSPRQLMALAPVAGRAGYVANARNLAIGADPSPILSAPIVNRVPAPVRSPQTDLGADQDAADGQRWRQQMADDTVASLRDVGLPRRDVLKVPPLGFPEDVAAWREGGRWQPKAVGQLAANAMTQYYNHIEQGMQPEVAAAWAANIEAESHGNFRQKQLPRGPGYGLMQWESPRRKQFQDLFGIAMEDATQEQQYRFRDWELRRHWAWRRSIDETDNAGDRAAMIMTKFEAPAEKVKAGADRANLANAILERARTDAEQKKK
jgi:hypothetical protein